MTDSPRPEGLSGRLLPAESRRRQRKAEAILRRYGVGTWADASDAALRAYGRFLGEQGDVQPPRASTDAVLVGDILRDTTLPGLARRRQALDAEPKPRRRPKMIRQRHRLIGRACR